MRRAKQDTGWLFNPDGQLAGITLGWDFVAEHEIDTERILRVFGTNVPEFPVGLDARQITRLPEGMALYEYTWKGRDKRRKGIPAAVLLSARPWHADRPLLDQINGNELQFWDDSKGTDESDVVCSWSYEQFGIHVRGPEQIARLKELVQAFNDLDICLAPSSGGGFINRKGVSFAIRSRVDAETRARIEERDRAALRLEEAVLASGIRKTLEAAGRKYFALGPRWIDADTETGLEFFLNPCDQKRNNFGWFNVAELEQWARGTGPIPKDAGLEAFEAANKNWGYDTVCRLKHASLFTRRSRLAWVDDAQTMVGVFLEQPLSGEGLPTGVYSYEELVARYPLPTEKPVAVSYAV